MITGDKPLFAIEAQVETVTSGWILGRIRFWIKGESCGNWEDIADLKGCLSWLRAFATDSVNRYEAGLMNRPKVELFDLLMRPLNRTQRTNEEAEPAAVSDERIEDAYARFHISHL